MPHFRPLLSIIPFPCFALLHFLSQSINTIKYYLNKHSKNNVFLSSSEAKTRKNVLPAGRLQRDELMSPDPIASGGEMSSRVTRKGGDLVENEWSTYLVKSAGRCFGISRIPSRFRHGFQQTTETGGLESRPGMSDGRSKDRSLL